MNALDIPCTLERDEYGHIKAADTDPYGNLAFMIGSGDDFHCFDYAFVSDGQGNVWAVLHSVINSETGSFIMDGGYEVVWFNPLEPSDVIRAASHMVDMAVEWCIDSRVRFSSREQYHFIREVAIACIEQGNVAGYEDQIATFSSRQRKVGGKSIDAFVNGLADRPVV